MKDLHFNQIKASRVLIIGDVGAGKTALTARLVEEAALQLGPDKVTVIDMAPERKRFKGFVIGGGIDIPLKKYPNLHLLKPSEKLHAPRIEERTADRVLQLAVSNAAIIEKLLHQYVHDPTPVLFMNDVSIYLQAGNLNRLTETIILADTFVGNAYSGTVLEDDNRSGLSQRERASLDSLKTIMDKVLALNSTRMVRSLNERS